MGFVSVLQILFIGLKLTNYIQWDWVWVLAPAWISLLAAIAIIISMFFLQKKE